MKDGSKYGIINLETGEIEPIDVYVGTSDTWERVYAKTLVDMLDIAGEVQTKIIAYMIKHKDYRNVVYGTIRKIAEETGSSTKTVQRTIKILLANNFIKKLQNGVYLFSPHVMRTGRDKAGQAIIRHWKDIESK